MRKLCQGIGYGIGTGIGLAGTALFCATIAANLRQQRALDVALEMERGRAAFTENLRQMMRENWEAREAEGRRKR
jgi:hypothetical protein